MANKTDYLNKLVSVAFKIDDKYQLMDIRQTKMQHMATLAREGKKDTQEYLQLEAEFKTPTVTCFDDEMLELRRVVKQLRKYKF